MNILFLTQVLPFPPDSGPKNKTLNVLKYLSRRHQVTLVSFIRGNQEKELESLRQICYQVHPVLIHRGLWQEGIAVARSLALGHPWIITRDHRKEMHRVIAHVVVQNQIDVAHADQLNMAQYALPVANVKRTLDAHNALWLLYQRLWQNLPNGPLKWLYGRDWRLLRKYEGEICASFDNVTVVSQEDREALRSFRQCDKPIEVIPITVDTNEISPIQRVTHADHILHVGTMFWPPNVDGINWFLQQIYSLIEKERPGVIFDVVGARPPQSLLDEARKFSCVNVTGYVKDILPYLQQAGVFIVPLRAGGGMRVKILEALAQGLPVVSTTIGCEGIAVEHGRHLLIADTPQEFAQATLRLLTDQTLAQELGRNGRNLIASQYDYQLALRPLDRIYPI